MGGGVSIFVENNIKYITIHDIKLDKAFNCIAIKILKESTNMKHNLVILNIYRRAG